MVVVVVFAEGPDEPGLDLVDLVPLVRPLTTAGFLEIISLSVIVLRFLVRSSYMWRCYDFGP